MASKVYALLSALSSIGWLLMAAWMILFLKRTADSLTEAIPATLFRPHSWFQSNQTMPRTLDRATTEAVLARSFHMLHGCNLPIRNLDSCRSGFGVFGAASMCVLNGSIALCTENEKCYKCPRAVPLFSTNSWLLKIKPSDVMTSDLTIFIVQVCGKHAGCQTGLL